MHICHIYVFNEIFVSGGAGLHSHAAPILGAELRKEGALDIAAVRDGDDHILIGIEIFRIEFVSGESNLCTALIAEFLLELHRLLLDNLELFLIA